MNAALPWGRTPKYRFRLLVALPLVMICFTLAAGFLPLGMFDVSQIKKLDIDVAGESAPADIGPRLADETCSGAL